jgi:hypothetical protein
VRVLPIVAPLRLDRRNRIRPEISRGGFGFIIGTNHICRAGSYAPEQFGDRFVGGKHGAYLSRCRGGVLHPFLSRGLGWLQPRGLSSGPGRDRGRVDECPVGDDRLGDVLDKMLAHRLEAAADFALDLIVEVAGNPDSARVRKLLQPYRHVDAVAVDVVILDDDVTDVDADAQGDPLGLRDFGIARSHAALDLHRALHGLHDAGKFD